MSRQLSQTRKAINERRSRRRNNERKRFEEPLRKFIEHKYNNIFEEYTELYTLMVSNHPNKRNLTKTKTFKDWMNSIPEALPSDILSTTIRETFGEDVNYNPVSETIDQSTEADVESQLDNGEADEADNTEGDEADNAEVDVENEVDDIMNELIENEAIRNILNTETEDEGIEISVFDEIEFDIEPFDFSLEVEEYDY